MPSFLDSIIKILPEVKGPQQKKLPFKEKLKWTFIILLAFYILSAIPLYGLGENALIRFQQLSTILGASFGSIMSLGIGPIVTASIVLQLLVGSGILKYDMASHEGKAKFQGLQNLLSIVFVLFEATIYVIMGGLSPQEGLSPLILIFQLVLGGLLVIYMDGVINKWGFGSGISLFIVAGVASQLMIRIFSPLSQSGVWAFGSGQPPVGALLVMVTSLINQDPRGALLAFAGIAATVIIFIFAVYSQAMKVEIPLSFGGIRSIRGHGIRWPLKFIYTSNIPVILIAALLANIQLWARLLESWGHPWLGTFAGNIPISGLVAWVYSPNIVQNIITGSATITIVSQALVYTALLMGGSVLFSIFWVQTAGMDARSQAKQIMASGLQVPGFRRDQRVLEKILDRYILPLTIMGAIAIGFLAATADVIGALTNGTSILLSVMIIYRLYEDIAQQHMVDMHPALRKMMGE